MEGVKSIEQKPKRKTHTSSAVKARYNAKTYQQYALKFRKVEDGDILAKLESVPSKASYIKSLIRQDIEKSK